ncbi:hypothetical protein Daus18300_004077 [Diaporthe australafricana]|uniref:Flavonol synthase n=1 Tax=Diaporthe australafricana TaxID=127596 RepID=A0ABR3XBC5_9PEZI
MPSFVEVPSAPTEPTIPKLAYAQVPETQHDLDWADLVTLDLARFDEPGGKETLARQLFEALQTIGFFYIINFGLDQEEVDRQFAIGKAVFDLPTEEKLLYRADLENGGYNGYKPLGLREIKPGIFDNTEIFNIPKFIPAFERRQPEVINASRAEIEHFARHIHHSIVHKLLVLFAIVLELSDENYFSNSHRYDEKSDCHLRYMKYHRRSSEENEALDNKWVRPHPGTITVNVADALEMLTNGFLKSSIHRVVVPPPDQRGADRLGVLYFVRPEDDLELRPVRSPVLERLGYDKVQEDVVGVTAGAWVKARVRAGVNRNGKTRSEASEQEIIGGRVAKFYD